MNTIDTIDNRPFKHLITTIGALPTSFIDSMSYYEMLAWLCDYLEKQVVPAVNNNAEALTELKDYVEHYFDNLDVQEEINTKLDEMAESGELTDIIAQYLQLAGILAYDTIADMAAAENLAEGSTARVLGDTAYQNGDGAYYKVRQLINTDVVDGYYLVAIADQPTLVAERIVCNKLSHYVIKTTDTVAKIAAILAKDESKIVEFETGTYNINQSLFVNANTTINLNKSELVFTVAHGFVNFQDTDTYLGYAGNGNITIENGKITGGAVSFCHAMNITFKNVEFENCLNDHILELAAINGVKVSNCIFKGLSLINDRAFTEYIQTDNMDYLSFPWFADPDNVTYDNTVNKNWVIENNQFLNPTNASFKFLCGVGNHGAPAVGQHQNIIIKNNIFDDPFFAAIRLVGVDGAIIENNNIKKVQENSGDDNASIKLNDVVKNVTIANNLFNCAYQSIRTALDSTTENIKIDNNTFTGNNTNGTLFIVKPLNIKVSNNSFATAYIDVYTGSVAGSTFDLSVIDNKFVKSANVSCLVFDEVSCKYYIYGNRFTTSNTSTSRANVIGLPSSECSGFVSGGNTFGVNDYHMNTAYPNDRVYPSYEISDFTFHLWSGNTLSLTNQAVVGHLTFAMFNKIRVLLGAGGNTQFVDLGGWDYRGADARTYYFPLANASGNGTEYGKLVINNDGTFNYLATSIAIRGVFGTM